MESKQIGNETFDVQNGIIRNPGMFENAPVFVPYFFELALDGGADYENYENETVISVFNIGLDKI